MQTKSIYHSGSSSCNKVNDHYCSTIKPVRNHAFFAEKPNPAINHCRHNNTVKYSGMETKATWPLSLNASQKWFSLCLEQSFYG